MRKTFRRAFALLLSFCLILSLLPTLSFAKNETRSGGGFSVGDSGKYVIAANVNGVYYGLSNSFSGKILGSEITVKDGYVSEAQAEGFALQLSYDGTNYTIQNDTHYLSYSSSTNLGASTTAYKWTIGAGLNGSWRITASTSSTRGVIFRASSYLQFGAYALNNAKEGSTEYFDVEILPIGTVADATEEVFKRVTSASDITTGRYILLFQPSQQNAAYQYYTLAQSEDSSYYAVHVSGTSLTALPDTLNGSESMIWTLDGDAAAFLLSGTDGKYLYNDPSTPNKLEYSAANMSEWTASYISSKQAFTIKSTYYLVFRDDSTYIGDNGLPLVSCSNTTNYGTAYFHLYKSERVVSACAHINKDTKITPVACTTDGRSIITCLDCGKILSDQIIAATGHKFQYSANLDRTHQIQCTKCDYEATANCNMSVGSCVFCGWSDGSVSVGTFQRITAENQITDGQYVLVVAPGGANPGNYPYYALSRQVHSTSYLKSEGLDLAAIPNELSISTNSVIWSLSGTSSGFSLSGADGKVLYNTNNNLYYADGTATTWTATAENGVFTILADTRYLGLRDDLTTVGDNGNPCFRCNSSAKSSSYQFYLFKSGEIANPECTHSNTSSSLSSANCMEAGTLTTICTDCGIIVSTETVAPLGHNASYVEGVAAGCSVPGSLPHYICTKCGLYFSDVICSNEIKPSATIVAPLGHDVQPVGEIQATCGTEGMLAHYLCHGCDGYFLDANATQQVELTDLTIPALKHNTVFTAASPATCGANGNIAYYTCEDCGLIFADEACTKEITQEETVLDALNHTLVYHPVVEASCTQSGVYAYYHCPTCDIYYSDDEYTETITVNDLVVPALGHDIAYTARIEPACTESGIIAHYYCQRCNLLFKDSAGKASLSEQDALIPATGHHYVNGVCTACGSAQATVDSSIVISHSLNLASDISVNFVVQSSLLSKYDSFYMECVIPEYTGNTLSGTSTVILQPVLTGSYYYFTLNGMTAVRMNDMIEATLYMTKNGMNYQSNTDKYSIATYAYSQLNKTSSTNALRTLCANLLRYGANAQTFKGYRTDSYADAAMTQVHKSYLADLNAVSFQNNKNYLSDIANPSVSWTGQALSLDSKITVRFVFNITNYEGNIDDLNLRIRFTNYQGETETVTLRAAEPFGTSNVLYTFDFSGLLAAELRQVMNVAVYEGDVQISQTLQYSADTYGNGKTGTLLSVCQAMMAYSDAALAYFQNS